MKAITITGSSETTAEDETLPLREYYGGHFRQIRNLVAELPSAVDSELYIIDPKFGIAESTETNATVLANHETPVGAEKMVDQAKSLLTKKAAQADIVVIPLTTDSFESIVVPIWDELVAAAQPDSIWCVSTSRGALTAVDLDALENQIHRLITYRRRGVARIGKDETAALLTTIDEQLDD